MTDIRYVVGIDEVGCGAIAGPLVVAAVAFEATAEKVRATWRGIKGDKTLEAGDSKKIKQPAQREVLDRAIKSACASQAVIVRTPREIDERLLRVVFPETVQLVASRCLEKLAAKHPGLSPQEILLVIDGDIERPQTPCHTRLIPGGDALDWRIGAASIVAKAEHDRHIAKLADTHPKWGFDKHRGYPTPAHKEMLRKRGLIEDVHRKSYGPVRGSRGPIPGFEE